MNFKSRLMRLAVALALAATISAQIPMSRTAALAQDDIYEPPGGDDSGGVRGLIQATVFLLVGYGIYGTLTDRQKGGVPPVDPTGAGGSGAIPPPGTTNTTELRGLFDTASNNADFGTFADKADKAGLKGALNSEGPYTIFAPTNAAFAALPAETLADLEKPENSPKMRALLSYHIIKGRFTIEQLKQLPEGSKLDTLLEGQQVTITNEGGLKVNGVPVVESDIEATNGIIHPIGTVLTPPAPAP